MLSYSRGPASSLLEQTVDQAFRETVRRVPDRDALVSVHQKIRLTFSALDQLVEQAARGLSGLGLTAGERVGIWSANCAEWVILQLACARCGLVLINVNPAYRAHELAFVLKRSRLKALFLAEKDARADYREILELARGQQPLPFEHVIYLHADSWNSMIAGGCDLPATQLSCHDVVSIQYTSGTTGSPKGVLLTHRNILNNMLLGAQKLKLTEADRICLAVPMYHCFGCVIGTLAMVTTGCALIMPAPQFDPSATLAAIAAERATIIYGVPAMFIAELEHAEFSKFDLTSLRGGIMAGAPCPIEVMRRVIGQMHCGGMLVAYGQTESSPIITMSNIDDAIDLRVSTIGAAMPETEVKIASLVSGETLPVGEQGELCTRGYLVMKGYDDEPEATRQAIDTEGWLRTGDLAVMRPDGYFRITGRAKDMVIRGGENIYPREIEEFLYTHPKIAEVQVVGLPDVSLGETVCAWIRTKIGQAVTEEEIRQFCCGKIAHFKIPQYIRFVDSFPATVTGKVQKYRIREVEIQRLGLEQAAKTETA
ncbi:MAG: AMP-binding protein [Candidatus Acidiferrales bacterium]